jgi:hypothetical protein
MFRVKFVKISKNVEEKSTSLENKVEEKCHRLPKRKNEEKVMIYAEVLKGRNHGQQDSMKKDTFSRRPYTFRQKRRFNYGCDQPRHEFTRTTSQRESSTPRYQILFYGFFFYCSNFGHKVVDFRAYGRIF